MNRRDIELLISAKETTGRTFKQVTSNIDSLNKSIEEQVLAAQKGEGSLQELKKAQEALAQAGRDLSALQGQIDAYEKLTATTAKVEAAATKASSELNALKAVVAASGTATAAQETKMQRLENAVVKTSAAFEKNAVDIAAQGAVLARAGIETTELASAQANIVNSARQVGAGLVQVSSAVDAYSVNFQEAKARETSAQKQATDSAKLDEAEMKVLRLRETQALQTAATARIASLQTIRDAEQALAAQNSFDIKIEQARRLGDASKFLQLFADAAQTVAVAENQLSALNGFRAVGAQAAEASRDVSQFVTTGKTMAVTSQEIANGLRAILEPGRAALTTLDGLEAAIATTGAVASAEKGSVSAYSNALNELASQAAAITNQGALIDTFKNQAAATELARAKFAAAQAEVQRLGSAMAAADAPVEALATDLKIAEANLREVGGALTQEETKLGELSRTLKAAAIDTNNLKAAQDRLAVAAGKVSGAATNANKVLGRGGEKSSGLFGLNPYEIQNLGYQINDVVVSLASGQKPLTVLFQQGSQISQLFPGMISNVVAFVGANALLVAGVGATVGVFLGLGAAISGYQEHLLLIKEFNVQLAQLGNPGGNTGAGLADISDKLQIIGVSAKDAKEAILAFAAEGLNTAQILEYSVAAKELADRLGIDVAGATKILTDIQQGGISAMIEAAEKTHDLTAADLDHAQALIDAGKAAEARTFIMGKLAEKEDAIAKATQSQWTPAVNNLKTAFQNFGNFIGKIFSPIIDAFQRKVNDVVLGLTYMTALLAGKGFAGAEADAKQVYDRQRNKPVAGGPGASGQDLRDRKARQDIDSEYKDSKLLTNEERRRNAVIEARRKYSEQGVSQAVAELAATKALAKVNDEINKEEATKAKAGAAAGKRAQSARDKAARQAETLANKQLSAQQKLTGQLGQLDSAQGRGKSATLEDRLRIVDNQYQSIFDTIAKLRSLGISKDATGTSLDDVAKQVQAAKDRLKAETAIKFEQEQVGLLQKQRESELSVIQDKQERGALGAKEALEAAAEVNSRLSPQIVGAAQKALEIANQIKGASPSPEMVSLIASLERIISGEGTTDIVGKLGLKMLDDQSGKLDVLLKQRDELVASYKTLGDLGLRTDAQVRELTAQAYAGQSVAISAVNVKLREQIELLHNTMDPLTGLPVLTDTAYNTWIAKLQAVDAGLKNVDTRVAAVNQAAQQAIAQGVTSAFKTAADSIGGLITGTKSFGDVIGDVFNSALSIVSTFLDAIAQVLVQMVALQVAKSLIGGSTGGFGSLFFHDGGVVGKGGSTKSRSGGMGSWAGAPKFHGGGGLGLKPDEYKAVLQRGEEVLTSDDPRHVDNLGSGGGGSRGDSIKQVLLLDPEAVPAAMQSTSGVKSLLTIIRQNAPTIKQALG